MNAERYATHSGNRKRTDFCKDFQERDLGHSTPVLGKDWGVIMDVLSPLRISRIGQLLLLLITVTLLAGCNSSSSGGSSTAPPPVGPPPPPVSPPPPPAPIGMDEAQTTEGVIRGTIEGDLRVFRGIRYAAPPTGQLRFAAAQAPAAFAGVRNATQFGSNCPQPSGSNVVGAEDCLFLNIWSHNDEVQRPVIVFLHGGGTNDIGGDWASSEGSALADAADLVVVTLNRRMGPLGYLAINELVIEAGTAGNYGTTDVLQALNWVSANIANFGGDPTRVMLAGQSAGAAVVCDVIASRPPAGLINSVAMHSPPCLTNPVLNDQVGVETDDLFAVDDNMNFVIDVGCDGSPDVLACLRALSIEEIVSTAETVEAIFSGVIDGVLIGSSIYDVLENLAADDLPMIIGSTNDEARNVFLPAPFVEDDAEYQEFLALVFEPPLDTQLYNLYPTAGYPSAHEALITLMGDILFNCRAEWLADAADTDAPVYVFNFARGFDNGFLAGLGATHTIDVPHLFETFGVWGYTPDQQALDLSASMQSAWRDLVTDPASAPSYGPGAWPAYMEGDKQVLRFDVPLSIENEHRAGRCPAMLALFQ